MEARKINDALVQCDKILRNAGYSVAQNNVPGDRARWCAKRAALGLQDSAVGEDVFSLTKANRWLGFVQGVIFSLYLATIEELKTMNKP